VVAEEGARVLGAVMVNISLLDDSHPGLLRLIHTRDTPQQVRTDFSTYPVDGPFPARDAIATGRPVLLRSLTERDSRYPALASVAVDLQAFACLPLTHGSRVLGVIAFGWPDRRRFPPRQVAVIEAVADLCAAALARADLFGAEQRARRAAERLTYRLEALQQLTTQLAAASDLDAVADVVLSTGMQAFGADAASLVRVEPGGERLHLVASLGMSPSRVAAYGSFALADSPLARDVVASGAPVLVTSCADRDARYPDMADMGVAQEAWANLPLVAQGRVVGIAAFGWDRPRMFTDEDVTLLSTLAAHTALAMDRAQLLAATKNVAETLQRALLPGVTASAAGWQLAAHYAPAVEGTQVGGDWYDAFALPDGRIGLVVGDVMGKGLRAAAVMGSVRSALRAFATLDPSPEVVLSELDAYLSRFGEDEMVTSCYGVLTPSTGELVYASAGHLPVLVVGPQGARWLAEATSPPLGVPTGAPRTAVRTHVAVGEVLVLYSDGLVEDRHRPLTEGLDELARAAVHLSAAAELQPAVEDLVSTLTHGAPNVDDLAVLTVRRCAGVPTQP
jgi:serine phosphatase RsbU (regulator of sigma subunit)